MYGGIFLIKCGIYSVEVFRVQLLDRLSESLAESLVVNDFALAQELDNIVNIRIVGKS